MIAYQGISQIEYTIQNNNYVCYTHDENRAIAKIFLLETYYRELYNNSNTNIKLLDNKIVHLENIINNNTEFITNQTTKLQTSNQLVNEQQLYIDNLTGKNKLYKQIILGSVILNVILLLAL